MNITPINPETTLQLKESMMLATDKIEQQPQVLFCNGVSFGSMGNFSVSAGKPKCRKTFNVSAIVAAAISREEVLNYSVTLPHEKRNVIYFDTEQSRYHCLGVLRRTLRMAGMRNDEHPDNLQFYSLKRYNPARRLAIVEAAISSTPDVGLVIIDGIRDLIMDFNSVTEATEVVGKLMEWSDTYGIHIHCIIHQNKANESIRGHLGTELNNKAETVIGLTVSSINPAITNVSPLLSREKDFPPFSFSINSSGLPEDVTGMAVDAPSENPKREYFNYRELTADQHRKALETLFANGPISGCQNFETLLRQAYTSAGFRFGAEKTKLLKAFLTNKRMVVREGSEYIYKPDFHF